MSRSRRGLFLIWVVGATALVGACSGYRVRQTELPPGQTLVALLPDPETGNVGRALVSNASGSTDLSGARDSTVVVARHAPSPVNSLSQSTVKEMFGDALSALPPPQRHYTLFFRFDSEELTDESRALASEIVRDVSTRRVPDVLVVGHTDRTGTRAVNFQLGLRRANVVRTLLRQVGLDAAYIDVVSHGETEPLVPTLDGVFEAKNRRVEITIK